LHDKATAERDEAEAEEFQRAVDARKETLNEAEGESLSIDDLSEVYIQVRGDARARNNMALNTTSKTGEINDYLEVRRPFGSTPQ